MRALQIVVALLIVVATVLFLRQAGGTSVPRESVLLVGPASGGKTTLLSLLCNGAPPTHGTVTSMVSGLAFSLPYHTHTLPLLTASKFLLNRCASCHECGKAREHETPHDSISSKFALTWHSRRHPIEQIVCSRTRRPPRRANLCQFL